MQECSPCISSWGANGYSEVWLNGSNDYAHKHLHYIGDKMVELAHNFHDETDPLKLRVLNQCAREVLLAQSSDWLFIITNGTMVDYAKKRIKDHVGRFERFYSELYKNEDLIFHLESFQKNEKIYPEVSKSKYIQNVINDIKALDHYAFMDNLNKTIEFVKNEHIEF